MTSSPSRGDLTQELQRLASELDRTPTFREMNEHGKYSGRAFQNEFGSWNEAVEAAGFEPNTRGGQRYSDDELIGEIQRIGEEVGEAPVIDDVKSKSDINPTTFTDRFGSWKEALRAAGFDPRRRGIRRSDEELLEDLHRVADEISRSPTPRDVIEHGKYSDVVYSLRFGGWHKALHEAGLQPLRGEDGKYRREDLIEDLQRVAGMVDREYITMSAYDKHGAYNSGTYLRHFGSWSDALNAAGLPSEPRRDRAPNISDEELIEELRRLANDLGESPTFKEMNTHGAYSAGTYTRRFGSWNAAVEAAGLEPNE